MMEFVVGAVIMAVGVMLGYVITHAEAAKDEPKVMNVYGQGHVQPLKRSESADDA